MEKPCIIGVDVGGTKISVGKVLDGKIIKEVKIPTLAMRPEKEIIGDIITAIKQLFDNNVIGVGIGVPGLLDAENGVVFDVTNIPSWKETHLKKQVEAVIPTKVYMTNDANCFVLGEKYFGVGRNYSNIVGIALGTGVGAGIIVNDQLCTGLMSVAGEIGCIPYLEENFELYCSGKFFPHFYGLTGKEAHDRAMAGDPLAKEMFDSYGRHIGELICLTLFVTGPELVLLGGSGANSYSLFENSMKAAMEKFPFKKITENLKIKVSKLENTAVIGAAALVLQQENQLILIK